MAKINLTNQQNQENSSVVLTLTSLGVLMCMVVTVLGIKLWWFKHRLSFEQTSTQNGAAGGNPPMVVVPRRNKKQRFQKDKRWSQQISENVEVHGVFRQKQEDDNVDIQRPQQLPPVRIRQLSESTQSLILPPPRNKPRQQQQVVHSTAFEDMDIETPIFGNSPAPSSSVLTSTNDSNSRLSLTFEEFEKKFKIMEIKPEISQKNPPTTEVIEKPIPPLRLSRSSSAMEKPEKTQHFLKSSQSITIPEFHKVIERRPTGFSKPTEDLTKIDEPKLFENFGERRPTGYIKYEEVDRDLNQQYEQELNQMKENSNEDNLQFDYKFTENGNWVSAKDLQALEDLRNEQIIYKNDLNESPDVMVTKSESFKAKSFTTSFSDDDFMKINDKDYQEFSNQNESKIFKTTETTKISHTDYEGYVKDEEDINYKPIKDNFLRNIPQELSNDLSINIESSSIQDDFDNQFSNWPQFEEKIETPKVNIRKFENHEFERQSSLDDSEDTDVIKNGKSTISFNSTQTDIFKQENIEKAILIQREPTDYNQSWMKENMDPIDVKKSQSLDKEESENSSFSKQKALYSQLRSLMQDETKETPDNRNVRFELSDESSGNEEFEKSTLKQRRPTGYVRKEEGEKLEYSEHENFNQRGPTNFERNDIKMEENQTVRSVNFNIADDKDFEKSSLKQRRPTGYVSKTYKEIEEDEVDNHQNKVKFESSTRPESNVDNYSLNKRRPTGYIRNPATSEDSEESSHEVINENNGNNGNLSQSLPDDLADFEKWIENQRRVAGYSKTMDASANNEMLSKDSTKSQVTFDNSIDFEYDKHDSNSNLKERRPTGYIKKSQAKELTDEDECDSKVTFAASTDFKETDFENSHVKQRRPTGFTQRLPNLCMESTERDDKEVFKNPSVKFQEIEQTENKAEEIGNSLIKERRPTGFVRTPDIEKLFGSSKQVNFNLNDLPDEEHLDHFGNEALKARRPTGYVQRSEINNSWTNNDVKSNEVDPLWQELEKDLERDFTQNLEEEFAKIRHSYELNEGDFLELKKELQINQIKPTGFGKRIEDDWDNFSKLETSKIMKLQQDHQEIHIISNDQELSTTSILKESKILIENQQTVNQQEEIKPLPRKSKVTFDFKTEEHIIPARSTELDSEEDDYYEDISDYDNDDNDVYNKPPPALPPQPMQRLTQTNYTAQPQTSPTSLYSPVVAKPTSITLFGSQISQEDNGEDDSWSAIRKHRNLTVEFQQFSADSTSTSPPPSFNTPPPKAAYRNPLAQLAIQRAKEVRMDMDGFKARSINDAKKHPEASKRNREKILNLQNDDFNGTEA